MVSIMAKCSKVTSTPQRQGTTHLEEPLMTNSLCSWIWTMALQTEPSLRLYPQAVVAPMSTTITFRTSVAHLGYQECSKVENITTCRSTTSTQVEPATSKFLCKCLTLTLLSLSKLLKSIIFRPPSQMALKNWTLPWVGQLVAHSTYHSPGLIAHFE